MTIRSIALAGLALLLLACPRDGEPRPAASPPRPASPVAPDLAALQSLLTPHRALRFDAAARERGCPADQSLGEYLAMLVHNGGQGEAPDDVHRLTGTCGDAYAEADRTGIDPPADAAYWLCRIEAYASDAAGDSPWHYELRVRVRRSDRAPDLATLACPGAS